VPDSGFINHFAKDIARIDAYVNEEIATLNDTLSTKNIFYKDNEFMDLIHNLQLKIGNAQISFAAPLQTKMNINPGKILMSELFNLYRYENLLYTMELSGLEIKNYLEYSYSLWVNTMQSEKDTLLQFAENGQNLKNPGYNFDSAEGIDYTVDLTKKAGERIKIEKLSDGTKFELNTKYKVAINSYRGNGGGGHLTEGAGINRQDLSSRIVFSTEKDLRYYMMEYLKEIQNIDLQVNNNWRMIPEPWVSKAILRENNLVNK
jgi:2',3'-cyclic-nucleotide 2'-phosphodiesterase/3'-nucleotidase